MRLTPLCPVLALSVCLTAVTTVRPAHADEPQRPTRVAADVYPAPNTQLDLALVGVGVTAAWYGAALGFSYAWPDAPGADNLRIPVAGPWMALGETGCAKDDPNCSTFTVVLRAILTTLDAVGQTGGVLVVAEAAFLPTQEPSASPRRPRPKLRREQGLRVLPVPYTAGTDGVGLGLVGRF